jgi:hypothetical protein
MLARFRLAQEEEKGRHDPRDPDAERIHAEADARRPQTSEDYLRRRLAELQRS